uniref:Uncharacterized protein n=1 Tax=viral metagenome TaxID=1070528 RepID=A0A6M3J514_9ZZZZ
MRYTINNWVTERAEQSMTTMRPVREGEDVSDAKDWPQGAPYTGALVRLLTTTASRLRDWWSPCARCDDTGRVMDACQLCGGAGHYTCVCDCCDDEHEVDCDCDGGRSDKDCPDCPADMRLGRIAGLGVDRKLLRRLMSDVPADARCDVSVVGDALVVAVGSERRVLMRRVGETIVEWEGEVVL